MDNADTIRERDSERHLQRYLTRDIKYLTVQKHQNLERHASAPGVHPCTFAAIMTIIASDTTTSQSRHKDLK